MQERPENLTIKTGIPDIPPGKAFTFRCPARTTGSGGSLGTSSRGRALGGLRLERASGCMEALAGGA